MSGEALKSTPSTASSGRTKIDDCVRGFARTRPERTPAQLAQLQFHCGKPPPAAEPRTVMRMLGGMLGPAPRGEPGVPARMTKRRDQRAATYIVISKPKRKSVAVGVCQVM
jgi:hypothetical protein